MANKIENILVVYNTMSGNGRSKDLANYLSGNKKLPFGIKTQDAKDFSDKLRAKDLSAYNDIQTVLFTVGDGTLSSVVDLTARASLASGTSLSDIPPFLIFPAGGVSAIARSANHFPEGRFNQQEIADNLLNNLENDINDKKLVVRNVPLGIVNNGKDLRSQFWYTSLGDGFSAPILKGIEKNRKNKKGWLRQVFGAMYAVPEVMNTSRNEITVFVAGEKRRAREASLVNAYFPRWGYTSTDSEQEEKDKVLLIAENNPQMHPLLIAYGISMESFDQHIARIRGNDAPKKRHDSVISIYPVEENKNVVFKSKNGENVYIVDSNVYEAVHSINRLEVTPRIKSLSIPVYFAGNLADKRFR